MDDSVSVRMLLADGFTKYALNVARVTFQNAYVAFIASFNVIYQSN